MQLWDLAEQEGGGREERRAGVLGGAVGQQVLGVGTGVEAAEAGRMQLVPRGPSGKPGVLLSAGVPEACVRESCPCGGAGSLMSRL